MTKHKPYREELLQWIWQHLEFDCSELQTTCGKQVQIIDNGEWNRGAGPDFLRAHLHINGKDWFGSVEIHKSPGEWVQHKHHLDERFNSVVLHAVYESAQPPEVSTSDGFTPFTLALKPYFTKKMHRLLEAKQKSGIACSGNVAFINQKAFEQQIHLAHQEYLEYKIDELLSGYEASLPLSAAWKQCLILQVYKTLGIPSNQNQMGGLAQKVITEGIASEGVDEFIQKVENAAFHPENNFSWARSGMRPASRPEPRVRQAAAMHYAIIHTPFQTFFKKTPNQSWTDLTKKAGSSAVPGKSRKNLIRQIVYLPALYLLGDLLQSGTLRQEASDAWKSPVQQVPREMKKPFKQAGFDVNRSVNVIGLAHQYKRYCRQKNCHQCEVFKKAIRS